MATTVDTLLVRIEADLKDVNSKLAKFERNVDQTQTKASRSFGKIATVAKGVFAAAIVAQTARAGLALVNFASGVEEMQAKSSVVFGEFTKSVRAELESFGDAVGRSTHELEGMAASVQDTFVPLGFARGEAAQLSTQLTKLAVDVASFNNASDAETMRAFQSAIVGNHETVRRFGIIITEATLQQELYRMGINKSTQEASNQEKVQARLNLIMAGTTDAHGDAARTSDSFANRSKALTAALEELAVNVLTPMLPALSGIVGGLVDATNAMNGFLDAIGVIDLDPIATQSEKLAEKQAALAEAQEDLAYWTKVSNGEIDGLARLAGPTLIKDRIEAAKEEIKKLGQESITAFAELQKLTGADQASQGRPAPAKPAEGGGTEVNKSVIDARKKVQQTIDDLRNSNKLLQMEVDKVNPSLIEQESILQGLGEEGQKRADTILAEVMAQEQLNAQIDARNQAEREKKKADDEAAARQEQGVEHLKELELQNLLLTEKINGATEAQLRQIEASFQFGNLEDGVTEKIQAQIKEQDRLTRELAEYEKQISTAKSFVEQFDTGEKVLLETQRALNLALSEGSINSEQFAMAQEQLALEMKRLDPMFKATEKAAQQAGDAIADSLADAVVEGKLSMDTFQDIFKNFIKTIIAEAIKTFVIKKIMSFVFGGFGGGGSVGQGANSYIPAGLAGGGNITRRATGGPVLVGERGPELFVPHSAGVIKNKMDTKNLMQGGGSDVNVYQTINVDAGVSQTVKTEMMNMLPRFKAETIQAVVDGKRRGKAGISKVFA